MQSKYYHNIPGTSVFVQCIGWVNPVSNWWCRIGWRIVIYFYWFIINYFFRVLLLSLKFYRIYFYGRPLLGLLGVHTSTLFYQLWWNHIEIEKYFL
jgi:hypothetical protein